VHARIFRALPFVLAIWFGSDAPPRAQPGVLSLQEAVLAEGGAAQNAIRWEDYTQTAIDPSDDCTIWYVGDYLRKGADTLSTTIGAFRLPGCPATRR